MPGREESATQTRFVLALRQAVSEVSHGNADGRHIRVLVALSGGPDSSALLFALHMVASETPVQIFACHVNHNLRGTESQADEEFCRDLCQKLALPFHSVLLPQEKSVPSEAELRERRFACLTEHAVANGCSAIFFGHTLNDQAETVLFRLLRGSSLRGLSGIPYKRHLTAETAGSNLILMRPLLSLSRWQCEQFLLELQVAARQDSSNANNYYARNFIRNQIVPLLNERFPGCAERIDRARRIIADEDRYLDHVARAAMEGRAQDPSQSWTRSWLLGLDIAIRRRMMVIELEKRQIEITFERVDSLLAMVEEALPNRISLDARFDAALNERGDWVWIDKDDERNQVRWSPVAARLPGMTIVTAIGYALRIAPVAIADRFSPITFPASDELEALFDLRAVTSPLLIRQRQPGDSIIPLGMSEPVRLKKYLHTHRKPPSVLKGAVLADSEGIIWVPGVGFSERVKVRTEPTHRLSWLKLSPDFSIG